VEKRTFLELRCEELQIRSRFFSESAVGKTEACGCLSGIISKGICSCDSETSVGQEDDVASMGSSDQLWSTDNEASALSTDTEEASWATDSEEPDVCGERRVCCNASLAPWMAPAYVLTPAVWSLVHMQPGAAPVQMPLHASPVRKRSGRSKKQAASCTLASKVAESEVPEYKRTTVIFRNLPQTWTRANLTAMLEEQGFWVASTSHTYQLTFKTWPIWDMRL